MLQSQHPFYHLRLESKHNDEVVLLDSFAL